MSINTRTHRIKPVKRKGALSKKTEEGIPWREVAKKSLEKYGEAGLAIRGARAKCGLTQKALADELNILPHHISEMEHGKRPISKKMADKLEEVLGVSYKLFL